jgi:MFS family permease
VFYGWAVVWSGLVVSIAQAPMYGPVVSIFVKPIADETGWSRAEISLGFTIGSIIGTFAGAPIGIILDRVGARGVVTFAGVVIAGSLVGLATMTEPWHLWLFMGAGRGIAMSGVQMGTMVAVTNWFVVKRGRASAIPSFGVRAGQGIVPLLILPVILTYGWREAYWALAGGAFVFVALPAWAYLRRRPEDYGLLPDGAAPQPGDEAGARRRSLGADEPRWTFRQAMHTKAFWLLIVATATGMFGQTAANLHAVANFLDRGMTEGLAFTIPAVFAGVSAVSTFAWGYAIERSSARLALIIVAVLNTLGMLVLLWATSYPAAALYGAIAGLAGGGFLVAQRLIWADYFGRLSVGTIRGGASLFIGFVGPLGPLVAGVLYGTTGDYQLPFTIAAVLFAVGFFAMIFAKPPGQPKLT